MKLRKSQLRQLIREEITRQARLAQNIGGYSQEDNLERDFIRNQVKTITSREVKHAWKMFYRGEIDQIYLHNFIKNKFQEGETSELVIEWWDDVNNNQDFLQKNPHSPNSILWAFYDLDFDLVDYGVSEEEHTKMYNQMEKALNEILNEID
jgi:hypothetical protein